MDHLFSIVIANYNYGRFLESAIKSVLAQCGAPVVDGGVNCLPLPNGELVELIVCDAKSSDNSVDVIRQHANALAWWCSEKDKGQSDAFNKGFSHARGKFLTWLNADDLMLPGSLMLVADGIRCNPRKRWFAGGVIECDDQLRVKKYWVGHQFSKMRALSKCITVGGPASFFSRDLFESVGGFDVDLHYTMDIDLWMKFYFQAHEEYVSVKRPIWAFRVHEDSKTTGPLLGMDSVEKKKRREEFQCERILRVERFGPPHPICRITRYIPVSILDTIIKVLMTWRLRGKKLEEVFHQN